MSDEPDTSLDRRGFLKHGAVGAFGLAGLATRGVESSQDPETAAQDEPNRSRVTRRIALPYPERLDGGPVRKILLLTDRTNDDPDVSKVDACAFSNWPPDDLTIWEGIVVDWENAVGDLGYGTITGNRRCAPTGWSRSRRYSSTSRRRPSNSEPRTSSAAWKTVRASTAG